jgi:hypothetical protein
MITFLFKAKDGTMDWGSDFNLARLRQHLKENEGKIYRVEPQISTRSLSQNNLYWMYLQIIERETGNNANDLHEYFRRKFLPPKFIKVMGQEVKIARSTTELKKHEFSEYMEKISAETGVAVPDTESYLASIDLAPTYE